MEIEKNLLNKLGLRIAQLRSEKGITQLQLGEALSEPIEYIIRLEAGEIDPTLIHMIDLALAFGVTLSDLVKIEY